MHVFDSKQILKTISLSLIKCGTISTGKEIKQTEKKKNEKLNRPKSYYFSMTKPLILSL